MAPPIPLALYKQLCRKRPIISATAIPRLSATLALESANSLFHFSLRIDSYITIDIHPTPQQTNVKANYHKRPIVPKV